MDKNVQTLLQSKCLLANNERRIYNIQNQPLNLYNHSLIQLYYVTHKEP